MKYPMFEILVQAPQYCTRRRGNAMVTSRVEAVEGSHASLDAIRVPIRFVPVEVYTLTREEQGDVEFERAYQPKVVTYG